MQPVASGEGGFWHEFEWDKAIRLGAEVTGMKYSGQYGFAETHMVWPISHMVSPSDQALKCCDCHAEKSRMNWKALGYRMDPKKIGSRSLDELTPDQTITNDNYQNNNQSQNTRKPDAAKGVNHD